MNLITLKFVSLDFSDDIRHKNTTDIKIVSKFYF